MLKHTKRQVNELCFLTCVFLSCLSPQFTFYFLSSYDGQRKRVFTTLNEIKFLLEINLTCRLTVTSDTVWHEIFRGFNFAGRRFILYFVWNNFCDVERLVFRAECQFLRFSGSHLYLKYNISFFFNYILVFRGKWLWSPANIKGTIKDAKIYIGRSTTM